jgi:hypothetical protein
MTEKFVTGYQFGPEKGEFRGEYRFPNNKDKIAVHVPPYTTLVAPPKTVPEGQYPYWDGAKWVLRNSQTLFVTKPTNPAPADLGHLRREFVEENIARGVWSAVVLEQYDAVVAANKDKGKP